MALATAINSNVAKVSVVMIYLSSKIMASTPQVAMSSRLAQVIQSFHQQYENRKRCDGARHAP